MIDDSSKLVTGFVFLHVKNPNLIYEFVFGQALCKFETLEQVRTGHCHEFGLVAFIRKYPFSLLIERDIYEQTTLTKNNFAE